MTTAYVYKWTEQSTGKWYIGSRTAKNCHPDDGYICSSKIVKPLIKSNPDNWIREILETGGPEDMYELESELLECLDAASSEYSYNMHNCGKNFCRTGKAHSDETKDKMRAAKKGKHLTDEHRAKISAAAKNMSDEHRAKIGLAHKGKTVSDETKDKMRAAATNRSDETKAKMSNANRGRTVSDETRAKLSEWQKGIPKPQPQLTCPHCGLTGGSNAIKRWHMDNCKFNQPSAN